MNKFINNRPHKKIDYSNYYFILPAFLFYIIFVLYPLADTFYTSFTQWSGIGEKKWVGLENYYNNLNDVKIISSIKHSFILIIFYSFFPIIIGLAIAGIMVRVKVKGIAFYRAILFLPQILSMIVVGIAWRWIYAPKGPLNTGLDFLGLDNWSRAWLGSFDFALPFVGLIGTWVMFGFAMILFIAGVQKIPTELYDAAKVDGAGPFAEFFNVTLPALKGEIIVALVFTVTLALRNFDLIYITTGGGPGTSTMIPSMFIYKKAFQMNQVGSASSLGIMLTLLIFTLISLILITLREKK
ncbi:MAG: carbohydrate ABC transporter permease [Candidatus Puniceispirillales bacterium]|jgi:raffinose/stachyose/melibiose transport system permease protein|nr:sugar ABC transporter permease [Pseudomonadota bacterium]|tara:strand:- start:3536 stop:4426 length:891 start_codon:yes stop_codon:yes gene_type:complete